LAEDVLSKRRGQKRRPLEKRPDGLYVHLFESANDLILVADEEGRYLDANFAATRLLGYSRVEFSKMCSLDIVAGTRREAEQEYARFRRDGSWRGQVDLRGKDGSIVTVEVRASTVALPGRRVYVWIGREAPGRRSATERAARLPSLSSVDRLTFLAQASEVLAGSLAYDQALKELAALAVPRLADWCAVDVMENPETITNVAMAHVDPSKVQMASEFLRKYPTDPHAQRGLPNVVRTGRSELYPEVPDSLLVESARDEHHLEFMRSLGLHSIIVSPLSAQGRTFGGITLVSAESRRRFDEADLLLAEELGRRAGVAIDNARLSEAERAAQEEAQAAWQRLAVLSRASELLATSLDYEATIVRLAQLAVQGLADLCLVDVVAENGSIQRLAAAHTDPKWRSLTARLQKEYPPSPTGSDPVVRVIRSGRPEYSPHMTEAFLRQTTRDQEHFQIARDMGFQSFICVPLLARGRILGTLTLVSTTPGRVFGEKDLHLAEELARRAATRIDNARLYHERDRIAWTLQQSLLPPALPDIPGFEVAALYRPAGEGFEVGGDFYDVFETADRGWALVVGDVCGKGPEAAAVTGFARHTIRAIAMHDRRPSRVLKSLNKALLGEAGTDRFCTVCYVRLRRRGVRAQLRVSLGGHPPPLVLRSTGAVEMIGVPGQLLGVFEQTSLSDTGGFMAPGDALILYTDGLLGRYEDQALSEQGVFHDLPSLANESAQRIAQWIEEALSSLPLEERGDDVAVIVLRCGNSSNQASGLSG
jgi:PAS domain S-box-containing protein